MPDYEYIHKEMARSGVTLSLLWNEYCETCRQRNELPLMYSQFCHYYQQFMTGQTDRAGTDHSASGAVFFRA